MKLDKIDCIISGDCIDVLQTLPERSVDLVYFDPPFFTQKTYEISSENDERKRELADKFDSLDEYLYLIKNVLFESRRILKSMGSVFLHCDKTASHHLRLLLDEVMGKENFQSEIIWVYKRGSHSKKGLLNSHQVIYFYSKTSDFKFNTIYTDYSETTSPDQVLRQRERNSSGKSVCKQDFHDKVVLGKEKRDVPLSDIWEIPYLNPKAKEQVGYPTQKPMLLLNRILQIATDQGDLVVDPFCGSGTTCVSAKLLKRRYLGIDISLDAVELSKKRLKEMQISEADLRKKGRQTYREKSEQETLLLETMNAFPVQRNAGIDGFLKEYYQGKPVPVKIQKKGESLEKTIEKLEHATRGKNYAMMIVIQTQKCRMSRLFPMETEVKIIQSLQLQQRNLRLHEHEDVTLVK